MKNSIYIKSIIFFLVVFFISNTLMVAVFLSSFRNSVNITNEDYLIESASIVKKLYSYNMSNEEIIDSTSNDRVAVFMYDNYDNIEEEFQDAIYDIHHTILNEGGEVIIRSKDTFLVIRLDNSYCIIKSIVAEGFITIRTAIVVAAILTVLIAIFVVFLGIGTFMKPLINMSNAARKVAFGDYSVRLEPQENKDIIGQLVDGFNEMCYKLSKTEMLRNDFISDISHEFKTPIQSIYGFTNLLKEEISSKEHKEYLDRILEEAERLSILSTNILQINSLENILDLKDKTEFNLDELIRQSILILENKWSKKKLELDINLNKIKIYAISDMMKQVIINLLDNAIKYTPYNGQICITLKKDKEYGVLSIKDSGSGIKEEHLTRVFEKFFKSDHSRNTSGNGLGLSIVKKILDLHNFTITASNSQDGGAIFRILFPIVNKK